jgi:hypothetical protein
LPAFKTDTPLRDSWNAIPVLWSVTTTATQMPDCSDPVIEKYLGPGNARTIKSFGHDGDGVHFLLTRAGTPLHNDSAYARYTHQVVIRNDGNRIRGLPAYDTEDMWHPPMLPGVMYALDTHSPHQGLPDSRMGARARGTAVLKAVIAVDRDELLTPEQAWPLLARYLTVQMADVPQPDLALTSAPRWRPS